MPRTAKPQHTPSSRPVRVSKPVYDELREIATAENRTIVGQLEKIVSDWVATAKSNGAYPLKQSQTT